MSKAERNPDGTWPSHGPDSMVNYGHPRGIAVNYSNFEYIFHFWMQQWYVDKIQHMFPHREM